VIDLSGRVLRTDSSIVKGARMEIWQANAAGRYAHPIDKNLRLSIQISTA